MTANFFDQFYAKSDGQTTLQMHTQHVITAGLNLLNSLSFTSEERKYWAEKLNRCAVLHDLGKIHGDFQKRLNGDKGVSIRHEIISLWFCENFLSLPNDELFAIATHHKGIEPHGIESGHLDNYILTTDMRSHYETAKHLLTRETLVEWLILMGLNVDIIDKELQKEISQDKRILFLDKLCLKIVSIMM